MTTETVQGSDDEAVEDENYEAKASTKKERKRQEREAQRQVQYICVIIFSWYRVLNYLLYSYWREKRTLLWIIGRLSCHKPILNLKHLMKF